jgi:hypothetical protein
MLPTLETARWFRPFAVLLAVFSVFAVVAPGRVAIE